MPIIYQRVRQFTVLELLITSGFIFILVGIALWALNPMERLRQGRDSRRLTDLGSLREAIDSAVSEGIPLAKTMGVPASSASVGADQEVDGTGWVAMELSNQIDLLPIDPVNGKAFTDVLGSSVTGEYQFISDGTYYVLRAHLEAEINQEYYAKDGNENSWWEVGTAPGLSTYFGL